MAGVRKQIVATIMLVTIPRKLSGRSFGVNILLSHVNHLPRYLPIATALAESTNNQSQTEVKNVE